METLYLPRYAKTHLLEFLGEFGTDEFDNAVVDGWPNILNPCIIKARHIARKWLVKQPDWQILTRFSFEKTISMYTQFRVDDEAYFPDDLMDRSVKLRYEWRQQLNSAKLAVYSEAL